MLRHLMQHARSMRLADSPVTNAPHLGDGAARRPRGSDGRVDLEPSSDCAVPVPLSGGRRLERRPGRNLTVLHVAPQRQRQSTRQRDDPYAARALAA